MGAAMWRLHRYYLRELAINASITFLVLFAITMVSLVARGLHQAQGGSLLDAAVIMLFWTLDAFPHLLPIAFLLATVLTFARANQDREIVALRSAGISPRVPMTAAVLIGLLLAIVGSLAMHYVLPEVHFRKYRVLAETLRNVIVNMKLGADSDRVMLPGSDIMMTFARRGAPVRNGEDVELEDCWIYWPKGRSLEQGIVSPIFHVDRVVIPMPDKETSALSIYLQGVHDPFGNFQKVGNSWITQPLPHTGRDERDDDVGSTQLLAEVQLGLHEQPTAAIYTLNRRTCFAVLPLLLAPLGFCIALFARDRGRALAMVYALLPLLVFYAGDVFGAKLLRATDQPLSGWLPAALLLVLGGPFCWRELRR
jgi:lipopolysaccharide export LptBFGC system permease protein LptF